MTRQLTLLKEFTDLTNAHYARIASLNKLNLTDEAVGTEAWVREIAAVLWQRPFARADLFNVNSDSFDLSGGDMAIQVTSDCSSEKIKKTLATYHAHGHAARYPRLFIFQLGDSPLFQKNTFLDSPVPFDPASQVVGKHQLHKRVNALDLAELQKLVDISHAYFGSTDTAALRRAIGADAIGYKEKMLAMRDATAHLLDVDDGAAQASAVRAPMHRAAALLSRANRVLTTLTHKVHDADGAELARLATLTQRVQLTGMDIHADLKALLPGVREQQRLATLIATLAQAAEASEAGAAMDADIAQLEADIAVLEKQAASAAFAERLFKPC